MKKNSTAQILLVIFVVLVGAALFFWYQDSKKPGEYDTFASCLGEKGMTFYGAFWCPHCQAQKKLFGKSQKNLPYVECSTADGKNQTQICIDKGIKSYPTWAFFNGSTTEMQTGEKTLSELSELSGCPLQKDVQ